MSISVVIPSYNQGQYLEETLQSVLTNNADKEILVIDGASSDNSVEIIQKYNKEITYSVSEKDSGQSNAINKGFAKTSSNIVTWLCSDDVYTQGALELVEEEFRSLPPDYILIYGDTELFSQKGFIRTNYGSSDQRIETFLSGMAFAQPSSFFKKSALEKVGYLDERLHYGMDYDLFVRLALIGKFKKVDHCFSKYRLHEQSKSVAMQTKFLTDWAFVFYRVLVTIGQKHRIDELLSLGIDTSLPLEEVKSYPVVEVDVKEIDADLLIYKFLQLIVSQDYISGNFLRCKKILAYLEANYSSIFATDSVLKPVKARILFPGPLGIKLLRKLRSLIDR